MSFDRPDYLEMVLQTIKRQRDVHDLNLQFFLFQDGVRSRRSDKEYGNGKAAKEAENVFRRYLPEGVVVTSDWNLGVARNFDRAERAFFEELRAPMAWFLEDDMILAPHYFSAMAELTKQALDRTEIGMISAYGYHHATPLAVQRQHRRQVCLMNEHNWAFGLTRECWAARDKIVREYLDILDEVDYRDRGRHGDEIKAFQIRHGRGGRGYLSSQDSVKNMACERLGFQRVSTFANFARYVGRQGEHMTAEKFAKRGYASTILMTDPPEGFDIPDPVGLQSLRVALHADGSRSTMTKGNG